MEQNEPDDIMIITSSSNPINIILPDSSINEPNKQIQILKVLWLVNELQAFPHNGLFQMHINKFGTFDQNGQKNQKCEIIQYEQGWDEGTALPQSKWRKYSNVYQPIFKAGPIQNFQVSFTDIAGNLLDFINTGSSSITYTIVMELNTE